MGGFDELIERLLYDVALSGSHGFDGTYFEKAVLAFYNGKNSSDMRPQDGQNQSSLFSDAPPVQQITVDDELLTSVLDWLCRHPDIDIRNAQNSDGPGGNAQQLSPFAAKLAGQRIYTTEDRIWHAITGHGVDHKRVPAREFEILSVIAAHGPGGLLQPYITKATGQDKRSVPKRTDILAEKGYIIKEKVIGGGQKTSLLRLKRFSPSQTLSKGEHTGMHTLKIPVIRYDEWFNAVMRLLQQNNNVLSLRDLRLGLGIESGDRTESRILVRCLRRLYEGGCVRSVTAKMADLEGHEIYSSTTGRQRKTKAIQLMRPPTELDRKLWMQNIATAASTAVDGEAEDDDDDEEDDDNEAAAAASGDEEMPLELVADNQVGGERPKDDNRFRARVPPQWCPEIPIANLLHSVIAEAGEEGIGSIALANRAIGPIWKRPIDEALAHMTDIWQHSQPPHLRHLTVVRDSATYGKGTQHRFRTLEHFGKAVESGNASWSDIQDATSNKAKKDPLLAKPDLDEWGFPNIQLKELASRDGRATLAEGRKHAHMESMLDHDDENDVVMLDDEQEVPAPRVGLKKPTQPGQKKLSSEAAQGTELLNGHISAGTIASMRDASTSTPEPAIRGLRGPYRRSTEPGRPDVPLVREYDITQQEIYDYDQIAQKTAENRVRLELRASQKAKKMMPDSDSERPAKRPRLSNEDAQTPKLIEILPESRVSTIKATLLARTQPGVYINPPGARDAKSNTYVPRGRPRNSLVAVFKHDQLKDLAWFRESEFASKTSHPRTASRHAATPISDNVRGLHSSPGTTQTMDNANSGPQPARNVEESNALPVTTFLTPVAQQPPQTGFATSTTPPAPTATATAAPNSNVMKPSKPMTSASWPTEPVKITGFSPQHSAGALGKFRSWSKPSLPIQKVQSAKVDVPFPPANMAASASQDVVINSASDSARPKVPAAASAVEEISTHGVAAHPVPTPANAKDDISKSASHLQEYAGSPAVDEQPLYGSSAKVPATSARAQEPQIVKPSGVERPASNDATTDSQALRDAQEQLKALRSKPGRKSQAHHEQVAFLQGKIDDLLAKMHTGAPLTRQQNGSELPSQVYDEKLAAIRNAIIEITAIRHKPGRRSQADQAKLGELEQQIQALDPTAELVRRIREDAKRLMAQSNPRAYLPTRPDVPSGASRLPAIATSPAAPQTPATAAVLEKSKVQVQGAEESHNLAQAQEGPTALSFIAPRPNFEPQPYLKNHQQPAVNQLSLAEVPTGTQEVAATRPPLDTLTTKTKVKSQAHFTTAYVNEHLNDTFHHLGGGRWARGLPPFNFGRKTAVRGPGASSYKPPQQLQSKTADAPSPSTIARNWSAQASRTVVQGSPSRPSDPTIAKVPVSPSSLSAVNAEMSPGAVRASSTPSDDQLMSGVDDGNGDESCQQSDESGEPSSKRKSRKGFSVSSMRAHRHDLVFDCLRKCGGVFPGDTELWFPLHTAWRKFYHKTPDKVVVESTINLLAKEGKLQRFRFQFKTRNEKVITKHIIADPSVGLDSPLVKQLRKVMTERHPSLYIPEEVDVDDDLRQSARKNFPQKKDSNPDGAPESSRSGPKQTYTYPTDDNVVVLQTLEAAEAEFEQEGRAKGFPNAAAYREELRKEALEAQRKIGRERVKKHYEKRKSLNNPRVTAAHWVIIDGSDSETEPCEDQLAMQREFRVENYIHDLSAAQQPRLPKDKAQISRYWKLGSSVQAVGTPQTKRIPLIRNHNKPLGSLRRPITKVRRKWWEIPNHLRNVAESLLMSPAQSFHDATGTISTNGLGINQEALDRLELRLRPGAFDGMLYGEDATRHLSNNFHDEYQGVEYGYEESEYEEVSAGLVVLKVSAAKLIQILARPPRPTKRFRTATGPYKSRKKRKIDDADAEFEQESDDEYAASPSRPDKSGPRRQKPASGNDMVFRDRYSAMQFKDNDRLITSIALVSALCGGVNLDKLNWNLIAHALGYRYEGEFLRRRWNHLCKTQRRFDMEKLRDSIHAPFLAAYEKGQLPKVDFQGLSNTDWPALLAWVQDNVPLQHTAEGTVDVPNLASTRATVDAHYKVEEPHKLFELNRDDYFATTTDMNRRHLAARYNYGTLLPGQIKPSENFHDDDLLLKSWMRATAMTKQRNYNAEAAAKKLGVFSPHQLQKVSGQLTESHMFIQDKKGRHLPGRNFQVHHDVLMQFKRWPQVRNLEEHQYLRRTAQAWFNINDYFQYHNEMLLVPVASDHEYAVLTNMSAQGMLTLSPRLPETRPDFDAPFPKLSPWGYGDTGYETKKVTQSNLKFDLYYQKTSGYSFHHELQPGVPIPLVPEVVPGERGPRIPFWVDVHGNLIDDIWDMCLRSVLHVILFRPGSKTSSIENAHNHKFWAWEINMMLGWMELSGLAVRCGDGEEKDGAWTGGWRAGDWWYCAFLEEMITWEAPAADLAPPMLTEQ